MAKQIIMVEAQETVRYIVHIEIETKGKSISELKKEAFEILQWTEDDLSRHVVSGAGFEIRNIEPLDVPEDERYFYHIIKDERL